jgi:hypothetical protein
MPLPFSPILLVEGRMPPLSTYIKGPLGGEFDTSGLREFIRRAFLSSPHHAPSLSYLSLSRGSPKGCVGARATPPLHDEVLQKFRIGSKPIYFRNLGWIRIQKESLCAIRVRVLRGTARAALRCCASVVALVSLRRDLHDLEVGYVIFIVNACTGA